MKENLATLNISIQAREAWPCSIFISEKKDRRSCVMWAIKASFKKKNFEVTLNTQF
jgi:hypothetical protein